MKKIIITVSIILCFIIGALVFIQHHHISKLQRVTVNQSISKSKKQSQQKKQSMDTLYITTIYDAYSPIKLKHNSTNKFLIRNKEELKELEQLTNSRLTDNLEYLPKYISDDYVYFIEYRTTYYGLDPDDGVTFILGDDNAQFKIKDREPKPDEPLLGLASYYCAIAAVPSSNIENIDNFISTDILDTNRWYTLDFVH